MSLQLPSILGAVTAGAQFVQDLSQAPHTVPLTARAPQNTVQLPVEVPMMSDSLPLPVPKPMIILHTVDIKSEDLAVLQGYGKTVLYDPAVEMNMPLSALVFDYLLLDLRKKPDRVYLDSQDTSSCHVIAYISVIESFDAFIDNLGCANIITEWPPRLHLKGDWNALLLKKTTEQPSKCLSCITFTSNFLGSLKKA